MARGDDRLTMLLDIVAECREPDTTQALAATVLLRLPELIACTSISWNEMPGGSGPPVFALVEPADLIQPGDLELLGAHAGGHPLIGHYERFGDGEARMISDFISQRQYHALPIYTELYQRLEVEAQLSVALPATGGGYVGVVLNRSGRGFDEEDRQLLDLLRPHLARAYVGARAKERAAPVDAGVATRFGLTAREAQVLDLVSTGATNIQVARQLMLSPRTVHKHLESIFKKMGVQNRTAAAAAARPSLGDDTPTPAPAPPA